MNIELHCVGINHRTAPIEIREKLWFSPGEAHAFLSRLKERFVEECALVSTCNRTELYYLPRPSVTHEFSALKELVFDKGIEERLEEERFYALPSLHAARHLFKLASGLDSMILGDVQILHQIKDAFAVAQEAGTAGQMLNKLFSHALHVGKRVRAETGVGEGAVSAGSASAELVGKIFGDLSGRTALLIGAGETGELTAKHLHNNYLGKLLIANRTRERAELLSHQLGATAIDYDTFRSALTGTDIIITSVAADDHVLSAADLKQVMKTRSHKPLIIVDLGVPRNVDPEASHINNVFLHDIDGLQSIMTQNLARREREIPAAQQIILEELIAFEQWCSSREVVPTIQDLQRWVEDIRRAEVERIESCFSSDINDEVTLLTKRIVNKILHTPMVNLKKKSEKQELRKKIVLLRVLFGLDTQFVRHSHDQPLELAPK